MRPVQFMGSAKTDLSAFPDAAKYKDFRQMLDKSGKDIDAVIIGLFSMAISLKFKELIISIIVSFE